MARSGSPSGAVSHVCSYENCGKTFSRPSKLVHHLRVHTAERPYECKECHRAYTRPAHLKRHIQTNHTSDDESQTFRCTIDGCDQSFKAKQNLKRHEQRVHINKDYKCLEESCSESFRKKSQLRMHMFTHRGITDPYMCVYEDCGKKFATTSRLERHKKMHEGYACPEEGCEQRFSLWTLLRKHKAIEHTKSAPCTTCGKTFRSAKCLQRHQLTHEEARDMYLCPEEGCERGYFDLRNLYAHQRNYHGGSRFKCDDSTCGRTFATKQKLQQHTKLHDPNRPIPKKKPRKCKPRRTLMSRITGVPDKEGQAMRVVPLPGHGDLVLIETANPASTGRAPGGSGRAEDRPAAGKGGSKGRPVSREEDLMGRGLDPPWSDQEDMETESEDDDGDSSVDNMESTDTQREETQGKELCPQGTQGNGVGARDTEKTDSGAPFTCIKGRDFEGGMVDSQNDHKLKADTQSMGTPLRLLN